MARMGMQITRLPPAVVSQLRSTTILSNVAQIAEELVCNSLDAGATKIEIAVDGEACHMKVDDDGCGISREDLTLVGERHATSKLHCLEELEGGVATLGFRGEALSSLSNVSLVEITSRCRRMPNTYRKILKDGATLSIGLSGEQRTHGTTVIVKDMFYNQPVRRRLLNSSRRKILQSVKECVMRHVLIHPQVSFTVKDLARKDIILHTNSSATLNSTLCNLFGADTFSKLQEIDYSQGHLRLTGFLSKTYHSHSSKALQYLYINRRYVLKTALHKLINSFGGNSKDFLGRINFEDQGARGEITSARHLCPVFVLNLTCPFSDYDITFEASKTLVEFKDWEPVVTFVRNVVMKIWGDHSVGCRQGDFQALDNISAAHVKSGGSRHSKTFKTRNASMDGMQMAVRRALVQIDSPDKQETRSEKWWDAESLIPKTPLWSPRNDSVDIPRILNTSDFLPEISSFVQELASSGGQLSYELKCSDFESDHSENEITWSSRIRTKRQLADCVSDDDELTDFFSAKSHSFNAESEKYLGSSDINTANDISWNLENEDASVHIKDRRRDSDATGTAFPECIDYRIFSRNGEERDSDTLQHQVHDFQMDSYSPRPKRRLDLDLDTSYDILKLHSVRCEEQKPCEQAGEQDKVHHISAADINHNMRGFSGPPFYRPSKRHGVHMNPPNSLSTVERIGNIFEDGMATTQREPDARSRIDLEAICGTNKSRDLADMPRRRTDLLEKTVIEPEEPRSDCDSQSTHARPFRDREEFDNIKESLDISEVERASDTVKGSQQRVEVDAHEHCKYRSTDMNNAAIDGEKFPVDTVKAMLKGWSNPCMKKDDDILDLSSGILASNVSSLMPESITKHVFKQARVLQQVDTKFIAAVSCGLLLLIDQHAADERVRLEELRNDVLGGNITKQISLLSSTQKLTMTFTEQQTLQTYSQQIQDWGWRFKIIAENKPTTSQNKFWPSTGGTCQVLLSAVPSILGVRLNGADLVEYLRQLTDTQGSSTPPPAVIRLLNNKACRGAIMFGDKLLPAECSQIVGRLKETLLCFQCAHGRPTMIPLVDIQALHRRFDPTFGSSRPNVNIDFDTQKVHRSGRGWHGLQSNFKASVERARARLAHAQGL